MPDFPDYEARPQLKWSIMTDFDSFTNAKRGISNWSLSTLLTLFPFQKPIPQSHNHRVRMTIQGTVVRNNGIYS